MRSNLFDGLLALLCCTLSGIAVCGTAVAETAARDTTTVQIETGLGVITLQLYPRQAPVTVGNFLRYVDAGKYDGASFYRTVRLDNQTASAVPIQVIQGGLHGAAMRTPAAPVPEPEPFPPIVHETTRQTGLAHVDGTISMARVAPGSATSEFFICIGDNAALDFGGARNPDGQGFAAFGRVTAGMDVVRRIHARASGKPLAEDVPALRGQILDEPVTIVSVRRVETANESK